MSQERVIRQLLDIDRTLGADAVPVNPVTITDDPDPEAPQTPPNADQSPSVATPGPALPSDPVSPADKGPALAQLDAGYVKPCVNCHLHQSRANTVFGEGSDDADLMFVGEGPGVDEDAKGRPFVGRAGVLLDKQIGAMGLAREQVYIANIVKCRPPGNRVPTPDEADHCRGYLDRQIEIIAPKVIVCLGATAAKYLLGDMKLAITRVRGQWRVYRGIDLMPTFHPAFLLRQYTPDNRRKVWDDLKAVLERLGLPIPGN